MDVLKSVSNMSVSRVGLKFEKKIFSLLSIQFKFTISSLVVTAPSIAFSRGTLTLDSNKIILNLHLCRQTSYY